MTTLSCVSLLEKGLDPFTLIIQKHNKERLKHAVMVSADDLMDVHEALVRETTIQLGGGFNEVVVPDPRGGVVGSGDGHQHWSGLEPTNLVTGALVGVGVDGAESVKNGDPDPGVEGDLIPDADSFE